MKLEIEIKRAEQSWDLTTRMQQNYLVVEIFGIEVRAPCTEEQLIAVVAAVGVDGPEGDRDDELEQVPVINAPQTFVEEAPAVEVRRLRPIERPVVVARGDDVGINQG